MWDEEKFFSDFKNEAKQIEPDSEFVERLLSLPEEKEKKVFNFQMGYRVATVAFAAVLLCVMGIRFLPSGVTDEAQLGQTDLHANEVSSEQDSDSISGTIGEINNQPLEELQQLLRAKDSKVSEVEGRILSQEEKEALADRIDAARLLQQNEGEQEGVRYQIQGEEGVQIEFEIVNDSYLILENGTKIYAIE